MLKIITLAITLLVLPAFSVSAQDWDKGLAAYKAGDYATALNEVRPLAEQGDPKAQTLLARMYEYGQDVPKDLTEAVRLLRLAADKGYAGAQYYLYGMYDFGVIQGNKFESIRWLKLAAEQGHVEAQNSLGSLYSIGYEGVLTKDDSQAVRWWRLAAEQGLGDAQYSLGWNYFYGLGLLQDFALSYMWFNLAAANWQTWVGDAENSPFNSDRSNSRNVAASQRDIVAGKMTPAQIAEAQKLARECVAKNYKGC
jgi:uncharacterized protein